MKIAINALHVRRNYNPSQDVYVSELLRAMKEQIPAGMEIAVLATLENRELFPLDAYETVICPFIPWTGARLKWEQKNLPALLEKIGADLCHGTGNSVILKFRGRQVVTVHYTPDYPVSTARERAQLAVRKWLMGRSIRAADAVVCASNYLAEGLGEIFFPKTAQPGKFRVIPMGVDTGFFSPHPDNPESDAEIPRRFNISKPYFLAYSHVLGLKNDVRILRAWTRLRKNNGSIPPVGLVLMGDPAAEKTHAAELDALGALRDDVAFVGFVSREDLAALYRRSLALVFPSLAESFGLCIIEAMACGVPVLTGNTTAMPETAGGAALLVDPASESDIEAAMKTLAADETARARLIAAGLERARLMSWRRTAELTLSLYREILEPGA